MDEETKAYLKKMNDGQKSTLRSDFQNTKLFLLDEGIVPGWHSLTLAERLARLERKLPN